MDVPLLVCWLSSRIVVPARALTLAAALIASVHAQETAPPEIIPVRPAVDLKKLANKLVYAFEPSVFSTAEFPAGAVLGDEKVRAALGDVQVVTTFYNEKFEEVKRADAPGRYGAVVRLTLGDGTPLTRFVTLYRLPEGATTQLVKLGGKAKVPVETGSGPEVAQRQFEEVAIGLKGAMGGELLGGPRLANLVMALPGVPPDQLLSNFLSFMARDDAWWFELRKRIGLGETYRYQTQLPDGYAADAAKRWPLILYLHGSGDRGDNLAILNHNALPKRVAGGLKLPAIVVSPQCPGGWWSTPVLSQLIDEVSTKYQVDPDRIIVTGLSMGGFGTWALAEAYPDRFSAIAPICGGGSPAGATRLRSLPVWAFHGQQDTTVPVQLSETMVAAIRAAGGNPHLTIYPDARHDSWSKTYATDALYTWLLAQQRGKPEVKTEGLPAN